MKTYFEDFNDGPGGWHYWISNAAGPGKLDIKDSVVTCRGPWWVDYNHAPPGGGYLNLLMGVRTRGDYKHFADETLAYGGVNKFVAGGYPTDFRGAKLTLRLRGQVDLQGSQLLYHNQAKVNGLYVNYVLSGQPFRVTPEWSEQRVTLDPDPKQWTCLGTRHDRGDFYGDGPIDDVLRDMNGNMILVLFPLNVVPKMPVAVDKMHTLRAGEDYELDPSKLPTGWVQFDWVRIDFPR